MNEIQPRLFLGDLGDAQSFDGDIICVTEVFPENEPIEAVWIPLLKNGVAYPKQLDLIARNIGRCLINNKVLVQCFAGLEDSPLAMTWFLYKSTGVSLNGAFNYIKEKRRGVQNRIHWIKDFRDYLD